VLAHAVLHTVAVRNGMELPPHENKRVPIGRGLRSERLSAR
jgi:hypothetical protein